MITSKILRELLCNCKIPLSEWGKKKAKTVKDLLQEIENGECWLRIDQKGTIRFTEVVVANIFSEQNCEWGKIVEVGQWLPPDERYRETGQRPRGKVRIGESPEKAMLRVIKEELGLEPDAISQSGPYEQSALSSSYPGLHSSYKIHEFTVVIFKPEGMFAQEGFTIGEEGKIRHLFKWENR